MRLASVVLALAVCGCGGFPLGDANIKSITASFEVTGNGQPGELRVSVGLKHQARKGPYDVALGPDEFFELDGARLEPKPDLSDTQYVLSLPSWKQDTNLVLHRSNGEVHKLPLRRCAAFTIDASVSGQHLELQLSSGAEVDDVRVVVTSDACQVGYQDSVRITDGHLSIPLADLKRDAGPPLDGCALQINVTKHRFEELTTDFSSASGRYDVGARTEFTLPNPLPLPKPPLP